MIQNLLSEADELFQKFLKDLASTQLLSELEKIRVQYLGSKGSIKALLKAIKTVPAENRLTYAQKINQIQEEAENKIEALQQKLEMEAINRELAQSWTDLSLPGTLAPRGRVHPVRHVEKVCSETLRRLGFEMIDGPEIEDPYYNFDSLNIPEHHPARDLQDTFWLPGNKLLRTHTTAVTARRLEAKEKLPLKIAVSGRVYRNEAIDATHLAMFHQLDGFWIDKGLTFAHLKGVTSFLAASLYGKDRKIRFKPKYYPYTEPSVGIDVSCGVCAAKGCQACHSTGWVTIMGAGMIHPNVFTEFGYDPNEISGIAFGWGTTRMATQLFGLSKLRPLYDGNLRLLRLLNGRKPQS